MKVFQKNIALILFALLLTGCPAKNDAPVANADRVVIRGSNTFGEELGPRLISEFKKERAGLFFDLESKGTGYGFGNLLSGGCDIAAASRSASAGEVALAKERGIEMNEYVIGAYNVALVVHKDNPVTGLTKQQVRDIFTGTITNWSEVGGADSAIHLVIRDPVSGTHLGFIELAMEGKPYAIETKMATSYDAIVKHVAADPQSIGYCSVELAAKLDVKALAIGGVAPSITTVQKGEYPYTRMLHLYTNKAKEPTQAKEFIDFVLSSSGQKVLDDLGYVPHP